MHPVSGVFPPASGETPSYPPYTLWPSPSVGRSVVPAGATWVAISLCRPGHELMLLLLFRMRPLVWVCLVPGFSQLEIFKISARWQHLD